MGKAPIPKKKKGNHHDAQILFLCLPGTDRFSPGPSIRSRAARREVPVKDDPSLSTKAAAETTPQKSTEIPSVLAAQRSGGIAKKQKTGRKTQLSSRARKRRERDADMAMGILERTERKVEKSLGRGRTVRERAKGWETVNGGFKEGKGSAGFGVLADDGEDEEEGQGWEDADEDGDKTMGVIEGGGEGLKPEVVPLPVAEVAQDDGLDDIL